MEGEEEIQREGWNEVAAEVSTTEVNTTAARYERSRICSD